MEISIGNMDFFAMVNAVVKWLKYSPERRIKKITVPKMINTSSILKEQENDSRLKTIIKDLHQSIKVKNYLLYLTRRESCIGFMMPEQEIRK